LHRELVAIGRQALRLRRDQRRLLNRGDARHVWNRRCGVNQRRRIGSNDRRQARDRDDLTALDVFGRSFLR
jgi:hypothetical protein